MEASSANKNFPKATRVSASEMHGHAPAAAKDTWIFNAEATSALLIAAWYIFGVYITLGIIPNNAFFEWGAHWVIPFLLGVFYLGAGYLYQRHQRVTSLKSSVAYLKREVIVLLTPFWLFWCSRCLPQVWLRCSQDWWKADLQQGSQVSRFQTWRMRFSFIQWGQSDTSSFCSASM